MTNLSEQNSQVNLSIWNRLLNKSNLLISKEHFLINGKNIGFPKPRENFKVEIGFIFITINCGSKKYRFVKQRELVAALKDAERIRALHWADEYTPIFNNLISRINIFDLQLRSDKRYLRSSKLVQLQTENIDYLADFNLENDFKLLGFDTQPLACRLKSLLDEPKGWQKRYNDWWIQKQLDANSNLFDQLEEHPLTESQRLACITDEDNILVLAGAGTGKTSTMVAKASYLVTNGFAKPEEIMVLAFGGDARNELKERVATQQELKGLVVNTFHSTGMNIVNYCEGGSVISELATDEKQYEKFVETQIESLLSNPEQGENFKQFVGRFLYPQPNDLDVKTKGQYLKYVKDNEIRALSGDLVKSFEELTIANYLFSNGIKFKYEPRYPFDVAKAGGKAYQPDFYLPDFDVYLEHFGIDKEGQTRPDINAEQYRKGIKWKESVHENNGTTLWQTFSWQSKEIGGLENTVEDLINNYCQEHELDPDDYFNPVTPKSLFGTLKELGLVSKFSKLIAQFLNLFKASPLGLEALKFDHLGEYNNSRWQIFKKLFLWVYEKYQAVLEANKTIDFADMINKATVYAGSSDFHSKTDNKFRIKYLLVDEFQDISPIRAALVKAIRDANPGCALMGVGDDWQAIYRFTGSDVTLTTEFEKHFGASKILNLDKTFRFNDRVEKVASTFVQANPAQLKKQLKTHAKSPNPEVTVITDNQNDAILSALLAIKNTNGNKKASVLFLARFKKSIPDLSPYKSYYPNLNMSAMSAHASKGKQADYVIILDVIDDKFGFPSKVDTDPILETLLPGLDGFKHAEERRLFYVALSRAKQSVYVLTERGKESEFIAELKGYTGEVIVHLNSLEKDFYEEIRCPECLEGKLLPKDGKFGIYYACSLGKDYCDTRLKFCKLCKSSPMIPNETHFECASSNCDNKLEMCPKCNIGVLKERKNSTNGKIFLSCNHYSKKDDKYCGYTRSLTSKWQVKSEQVR